MAARGEVSEEHAELLNEEVKRRTRHQRPRHVLFADQRPTKKGRGVQRARSMAKRVRDKAKRMGRKLKRQDTLRRQGYSSMFWHDYNHFGLEGRGWNYTEELSCAAGVPYLDRDGNMHNVGEPTDVVTIVVKQCFFYNT